MSNSNAASKQQLAVAQQRQEQVQQAVKALLGRTQPLEQSHYANLLRTITDAVTKSVNIQIAADDLRTLKDGKYKLCFAKKVGDAAYNVVWQSYDKYLMNNTFSWTPQYQLFGTNTFQDNVTVTTATNIVTIGLGQQSILDDAGILGAPSTGGPETAVTLINKYNSIHPGINQLSTGIDGKQVSTPIYVATSAVVQGSTSLTPKESILVWFQQDVQTSTMFSSSRSNAQEIDLTFANSATYMYSGQKWIIPS
ncbi:hypothetical protein [Pseudomonas oryziphila]|uniref:Uncharacterized protein n=1 Tax=Pseudomonas oryziphila TaxID=2894079 RepID=A0ABN5TFJ0_9PSED|nr:hypothetical protein [Pseudomonas oryziphila]AZL73838.1 hypothetical protein EI693_12390 [Pseudomonas oryziphila]